VESCEVSLNCEFYIIKIKNKLPLAVRPKSAIKIKNKLLLVVRPKSAIKTVILRILFY